MAYNTISVVPSGLPDKEQILPINVTFTDNNGKTTVIPTELPTAGRGPAGKDGTTWYLGLHEPTDSSFTVDGIPETGDIYLCTVSCNLYKYTGTEWNFTQKLQVRGLLGVSKLTGEKVGETVHLNISYNDGSSDVFSFDIPVPHIDLSSYISTKPISTGVSPNSLEVGNDTINYKVNNLEVGTALNVDGDTTFSKTPKIKLANGLDTTPVSETTQTDVPTKGWVDTNYTYKYTTLPATPNAGKNSYTVSTDTIFSGTATFNTPVALESIGSDVPGKTTSIAASTSWVDKYYALVSQTVPATYNSATNTATVNTTLAIDGPVTINYFPEDVPNHTGFNAVNATWVDTFYLPRSTVYLTTKDDQLNTGLHSIYVNKTTGNVVVEDNNGHDSELQYAGNYITTPADKHLGDEVKSLGVDKGTQRFIGKTDDGEIFYSASLADIAPLITATAAMVGIPQPWPTDDIPAGYLLCDGSAFDKTLYPALAKMYPSGKVPDLRGMFLRGLDPTGNVDNYGSSPRTVLSKEEGSYILQDDQRGTVVSFSNRPLTELGWDYPDGHAIPGTVGSWTGREYLFQIYSSQQVGIARPKNVAFNYIVFTGAGLRSVDVGTADLDSTKYFPLHGGLLNGSVYSTDVNGDTQYTIRPYQPNDKGFFQVDYGSSGNVKLGTLNADPSQFNVALSNGTTTTQWTFNRDKQTITTPANETVATEEWAERTFVAGSTGEFADVQAKNKSLANVLSTMIGVPVPFPLANAPVGYLICDGSSFDVTTYPALAKVYPNGKLPDLRGLFIRGWDPTGNVDNSTAVPRPLLSFEEGSYLTSDVGTNYATVDMAGAWGANLPTLGWDNPTDTKLNVSVVGGWGGYQATASYKNLNRGSAALGVTRPKNMAFNYVVYTGVGLDGTSDNLVTIDPTKYLPVAGGTIYGDLLVNTIASNNNTLSLNGFVFSKVDGSLVDPNKNTIATQPWVDSNYVTKSNLQNTVESLQTSITQTATTVNQSLTPRLEALSQSISDTQSTLNDTITKQIDTLNTQVSDQNKTLSDQITQEVSRAKGQETSLSSSITSLSTQVSTDVNTLNESISTETNRAQSAESKLSQSISEETSRAEAQEASLSKSITDTNTALANEVTRATDKEGQLDTEISTLTKSISDESSRAQSAESELTKSIGTTNTALQAEVTRATDKETDLSNQITSVQKSVTDETSRAESAEEALSKTITDTNTALQSEISRAEGKESELSSGITAVQKSVSDESTRAQTEEAALSKAISDESTRAQAAEKTNATNIANNTQAIASEVSRAEAAESALSDNITKVSKDLTAEVSRAQGVENTLSNSVQTLTTDLSNETTRATKAEEDNSQAITAEQTRATQAEEALTANITNEAKRAQEAESSLSSALSGEVSRATQAETQLNNQITQEAQRAQSAEDKLRQSLSGYAPLDAVDYSKLSDLKLQAQTAANLTSSMVGIPVPWPSNTIPEGFLLCDGSGFDTNTYSVLAQVYPDGKLPDLRGMFIRGLDPTGNVDNASSGTRQLGTFEEGSFAIQDIHSTSDGFYLNNDVSGDGTRNLNWDKRADISKVLNYAYIPGPGYANTGMFGSAAASEMVGVMRPKNIAFNYIVFAGKYLQKATMGFSASDNVDFTGQVGFEKIPTVNLTDTAPVTPATNTQVASKQWVDAQYASKSDIDYTKLSSLETQAQQSVNAVSTLVGIPLPWPSASIPQGYLLCDGSAFDINMYPLLAKAYPDGKLPDLRGMFIRGLDPTGNIDSYNGTSRTLLSHEEGTVDGYSYTTDLAAVVYNRGATPYTTHGLDWVGDPNQHYAVSFASPYTGTWTTGNIGNSYPYSLVGVVRPKNVAFNYIVYTGQSLQRADTSLVASDDANFIGNITFSKVPTLSVTDTSPVSSQTAQQIASKAWTDANYVSKATIQTSVQPAIQQETQRAQQAEQQITSSLSNYVTKDAVDYNQLESLKQQAQKSINTVSTLVGIPMPWPSNTIPDGYLLCDGSGFDVTQYNLLAEVYPDGKLPDLRGMFIRGLDTTGNIDNVIGGRKILTREEGSFLIQDSFVAVSNFYLNNNPNPDPNNGGPSNAPAGLNWDKRDDPNENFAFAFAFSNGQSGTNAAGSGIAGKDMVSVARPKNIAFNYIVYTGKTLQKASVNLLASDDVDFTGTVSFEKTPTLKSTDTTPISDSNKSDVASKSWVDSNYAQKNGVDVQSLENAKQSALAAANTVNNMVGIPLPWPTTVIPQGYLLCDGSGFDVNRYPKLAAMYPTGKLPDLRGMFIRGLDPTGNVDNTGPNPRQILSYEEGSLVGMDWATNIVQVDVAGSNGENVWKYNLDKCKDLSTRVQVVWAWGSGQTSGTPNNVGNYGSGLYVTRPKNIAFNYIVYTGDPTVPATVGLLASEDTNFTGKVTFTQPPQVASNDTAPVTASSVNDAASKGWVDANYATKVQNAQALGASAQNALNTISTLVGIPMPWPTTTIPQGYLLCDGSSFDTGRYPLLAKVYPNGKLPDLRGMFIRGLDPTGNVDNAKPSPRTVLSYEEGSWLVRDTTWQVLNFVGNGTGHSADFPVLGWDRVSTNDTNNVQVNIATPQTGQTVNAVGTNTDNLGVSRPKNIAFNYIVFTGQGVTTADVSLIAKSNVEFSGNVSFDNPVNFNNGGLLTHNNSYSAWNGSPSLLFNVGPGPEEQTGSMSLWAQVDGYRQNSTQLVLGGNSPGGDYRSFSFNPQLKTILSPDYNPYPELIGLGNNQRVVTQCFYVQINNDIQQIFFPVPFASATGINIQCTLAGYPGSGAALQVPYFGAPMPDNSEYPVTTTSFWVDMSGAAHWQGAGFWVQATGVMN